MAKGNPFLGTVSGSFGDLTLKNYRGKQVLTRKSTKPHNPRTSKQIYQRMFFATVGKARAALKNIIDHSFEQIPHGVDSLNYFQKRNIALLREGTVYDYAKQSWVNPDMNFVAPKSSDFSVNPYVVSEGSLAPFNDFPPFLDDLPDLPFDPDYMPHLRGSIPFFCSFESTGESTAEDITNNCCDLYNIFPGDYVTAVIISVKRVDLNNEVLPLNFTLHFVRFKAVLANSESTSGDSFISLLPTNIDGDNFDIPTYNKGGLNATVPYWFYSSGGDPSKYLPYIDFSVPDNFILDEAFDGKRLQHEFKAPLVLDEDIVAAFTWIHSREAENTILTSTQNLVLNHADFVTIPSSLDLKTAFDLWTKQGKAIGDARYLLEGGDV